MDDNQFKKFIKSMKEMGLKRKPKDRSTFPLDFLVFYKGFELNFEFLTDNLTFYFANYKEGEAEKRILREIKKKIEAAIN